MWLFFFFLRSVMEKVRFLSRLLGLQYGHHIVFFTGICVIELLIIISLIIYKTYKNFLNCGRRFQYGNKYVGLLVEQSERYWARSTKEK